MTTPDADADAAALAQKVGQSYWEIVIRQFQKHRLAVWSLRFTIVFFLIAIFAPFLANNRPLCFFGFKARFYENAYKEIFEQTSLSDLGLAVDEGEESLPAGLHEEFRQLPRVHSLRARQLEALVAGVAGPTAGAEDVALEPLSLRDLETLYARSVPEGFYDFERLVDKFPAAAFKNEPAWKQKTGAPAWFVARLRDQREATLKLLETTRRFPDIDAEIEGASTERLAEIVERHWNEREDARNVRSDAEQALGVVRTAKSEASDARGLLNKAGETDASQRSVQQQAVLHRSADLGSWPWLASLLLFFALFPLTRWCAGLWGWMELEDAPLFWRRFGLFAALLVLGCSALVLAALAMRPEYGDALDRQIADLKDDEQRLAEDLTDAGKEAGLRDARYEAAVLPYRLRIIDQWLDKWPGILAEAKSNLETQTRRRAQALNASIAEKTLLLQSQLDDKSEASARQVIAVYQELTDAQWYLKPPADWPRLDQRLDQALARFQNAFAPDRVSFVSRWYFPVFQGLSWLEVAFLLLVALSALRRGIFRLLRALSGAFRAGWARWLLLVTLSATGGLAYDFFNPDFSDPIDYKKEVAEQGITMDWALWPPVRFGFDESALSRRFKAPGAADVSDSFHHLLGTDVNGRDLLTRMIWGARISLSIGFVAVSIYVVIGIVFGALAGYFGGWVDLVISRFIEWVICFPTLMLILAVIAFIGPSIFNIMIVIGITGWTGVARLVRGEFLRLKSQDFVVAGTALGLSNTRIIFRHILPNGMAPVLVAAAFGIASAILTESSLSFLGFGVMEPIPSWGAILKDSSEYREHWWLLTIPGLAIFLSITFYNLVGEAFRDAVDPKLRQ